jgi:hypothetical protein
MPGEDWNDVFTEEEVVEDQPIEESETETEEETEVIEDVVEPDNDEETTDEESDEEEPLFNDDTEIELGDDQKIKLSELKDGFLRQSDYTKKTQALADERKTFEAERTEHEPVAQLNKFLSENPYVNQQIVQAVNEFMQTGDLNIEDALQGEHGQYINHLMGENSRLTKQLESVTGEYEGVKFNTQMDKTIGELKGEYGDLITEEYETQLRKDAKDNNYSADLIKKIAKGDLAEQKLKQSQKDSKKLVKETEAKLNQKNQEKRDKMPTQPKSKGQKPQSSSKPVEDMGWDELFTS